MTRPARTERSTPNSKGRPKRRAATNYLFKYQLAGDPNRIEDNALKKALQESLEEHTSSPAGTSVMGKNIASNNNKSHSRDQSKRNRAVINSSTNSSDVSKGSNNSSTTSSNSESRDISTDNGNAINKRLRSNTSLQLATPPPQPPPNKRAKLTTNGHSNSRNNKDCDIDYTCVLIESPVPPFNRAISRTYSRNSQHQQIQKPRCDVSPRSSTPIASNKDQMSSDKELIVRKSTSSVSTSTQTSTRPVVVSPRNNSITTTNITTNHNKSKEDLTSSSSKPKQNNNTKNMDDSKAHQPSLPVQNQYLKFKRESKNYAYAKMTALKVNTGKSYYIGLSDQSSSSSSKKVSSNGVLNNSSTNKNSYKTSSKSATKLNAGQPKLNIGVGSEQRSNQARKSPSPSNATKNSRQQEKSCDSGKTLSRSFQSLQSTTKISIPKNNLSATSQGQLKTGRSSNHTLDLSRNQNQSSVNVSNKRIAQGSWSLLGVPEEKVLYIRDDEPPKRLICYPAIKHIEGDVIQVRDSVLLRSGAKQTDLPYIAKVCAFWEDAETGGVMMSLFWYYRPEHIEEGRKPHHLVDEIFASRHRDADSVECIEDKCYVLTFNEYCRYRKRCKMEQVNTTWSLADVTIPVSNESYPRRNRIPDSSVNPELVFCCRQIYDSRMKRLVKNPLINPKYGNI